MSNPKAIHYWTQLRLALSSGSWSSTEPAKAPNGAPLSWSELLRKFNKHCKGFNEIAEVANRTQGVSVWLSGAEGDDDADGGGSNQVSLYPLQLGQECILSEERRPEARASLDLLLSLGTSNSDVSSFRLPSSPSIDDQPLDLEFYHSVLFLCPRFTEGVSFVPFDGAGPCSNTKPSSKCRLTLQHANRTSIVNQYECYSVDIIFRGSFQRCF